ncbi:MAG: GNAT family N-acetyltransferase [Pseudomonadota bacterium]
MPDYRVRRVIDDAEAESISRLGAQTFTETFSHLYPSEDLDAFLQASHRVAHYRDLINDTRFGVWVGEIPGADVIAYGVAGPCALPIDPALLSAGELVRLYVLAGNRDSGLGAALMDEILPWLENRYTEIFLGVWSENTGAQRFYARYGFEKVGEYLFKVGASRDLEYIFRRG